MNEVRNGAWMWLSSTVLAHLVLSIAHGAVHSRAGVTLSTTSSVFVFVVILAGPLIGLALAWPAARAGCRVIAATMAASLIFGVINHFVLSSPDHVSHVDPKWRALFTSTAVLLAMTETAGAALALRLAREGKSS